MAPRLLMEENYRCTGFPGALALMFLKARQGVFYNRRAERALNKIIAYSFQ
jgi:hypothetical protein